VLSLELEAEAGIMELLDQDPFANLAGIEAVREGLCNAVRHGEAKQASLLMTVEDFNEGRRLKIALTNDGHSLHPDDKPGFGSTILDEVTSSWQLSNGPSGVQLVAEVPISAQSLAAR
jgi:glucose-6-phosphate-specific signal transduction histidine kinase